MLKKLTRQGDNLALVIGQSILDLLPIGPDTAFDVTTDGERLILTPIDTSRRKNFDAAQEEVHKRYGKLFQKLAE